MKDRIVLEEPQVVPFLEASLTLEQALADLDKKVRRGRGHSERVLGPQAVTYWVWQACVGAGA